MMGLSIIANCDKVMDEFGSTCGQRTGTGTRNQDEAIAYLRSLGWAVVDATGGATLCPMHARMAGFPGAPLPPRRSTRDRAFGEVVQIVPHLSGPLPED